MINDLNKFPITNHNNAQNLYSTDRHVSSKRESRVIGQGLGSHPRSGFPLST
jgi:hypothetical protein